MRRVSDPQVSPSGKWVMFSVVDVDLAANTKTSHLWVVPMGGGEEGRGKREEGRGGGRQGVVGDGGGAGGGERQITFWKDGESGGRFSPDGKKVLFVSADGAAGGASQIFLADWDEAGGKIGTPQQLTHVSTEADGAIWSPDSQRILFVSRVYPECSTVDTWLHEDECNKRRDDEAAKSPVKAMVFDYLLYRHWDHYVGPKRSHVLVVSATDGNAVRDLTPGQNVTDAEVPTFSLGGPLGYAWAPDSKEIAYVTNLDLVPAASTNNDIYTLRLDEPGATPVKISTSPGSDDGPAYSPDGKWIAFRSQARAGYESDRFRLMLFDGASRESAGSESAIRELLPKFDRWVDEFVWAQMGRPFILQVGMKARRRFFTSTACRSPLLKPCQGNGEYSDLTVRSDVRWPGFCITRFEDETVDMPT